MAEVKLNTKKEKVRDASPKSMTSEESSLKGTLFSVFTLGIFIVISWVSVFLLFLSRQ